MRQDGFKALAAASLTALSAYADKLLLPVAVLIAVMAADYVSGMAKAWMNSALSSKTGVRGIVKKVCYLLAVCAGGAADFLLSSATGGDARSAGTTAAMVAVWLIINELVSILENLRDIGVPLPAFLVKLTKKLLDEEDESK